MPLVLELVLTLLFFTLVELVQDLFLFLLFFPSLFYHWLLEQLTFKPQPFPQNSQETILEITKCQSLMKRNLSFIIWSFLLHNFNEAYFDSLHHYEILDFSSRVLIFEIFKALSFACQKLRLLPTNWVRCNNLKGIHWMQIVFPRTLVQISPKPFPKTESPHPFRKNEYWQERILLGQPSNRLRSIGYFQLRRYSCCRARYK